MKQAVLRWSKKPAHKKHTRTRRNMKSVTVQRKPKGRNQASADGFWDSHLAQRNKKPQEQSKWELLAIIGCVFLLLYIVLCYENFHFHVAHMYAHLGYPDAQHIVGQRYLKGVGVKTNEEKAMQWFRQAAEKGHPHSSFNLAMGKLKNMSVALEDRYIQLLSAPMKPSQKLDVEKLLNVAANHGLQEAENLLRDIKKRHLP